MPKIIFDNYPAATVACFDATYGELPRRELDIKRNNHFLKSLADHGAEAVLIGASTGHGHVRTPEELDAWFASTRLVDLGATVKIALLRPEDGPQWHVKHVQTLKDSGFDVAFVRPGTDLDPNATDEQVALNMNSANRAIAEAGLTLGVYSIPDVSGLTLRPDAVALIRDQFSDSLVAVKITESSYENSTRKFLNDSRLNGLKIVQGWDPFLANALKDDPNRCGVTSGPMSFALFQYLHILDAAGRKDWGEVTSSQQAVTKLFQSMQDDPARFADLQRAKYMMGLGYPLTSSVSSEQTDRVLAALDSLPRTADQNRLAKSLDLMGDGPFSDRLQDYIFEQ